MTGFIPFSSWPGLSPGGCPVVKLMQTKSLHGPIFGVSMFSKSLEIHSSEGCLALPLDILLSKSTFLRSNLGWLLFFLGTAQCSTYTRLVKIFIVPPQHGSSVFLLIR